MQTAIFKKKVTPRNGNKPFTKFITTLHNKDGEPVYCDVHFSEEYGQPKNFPCMITFDKSTANLQTRTLNKGKENERIIHNLWINQFTESEYIDHSLDDIA